MSQLSHSALKRPWPPAVGLWLALCLLLDTLRAGALTTLEYRIAGVQLSVTPAVLSVPKGIAGSVLIQLTGVPVVSTNSFVEATLRGPAFPARRLIGQVNAPLLLPAIPLVGDYELDDIK